MVHVEHTFRKMELTRKNPRTTLYSRITARKWGFVSPSELKLVWSCGGNVTILQLLLLMRR